MMLVVIITPEATIRWVCSRCVSYIGSQFTAKTLVLSPSCGFDVYHCSLLWYF